MPDTGGGGPVVAGLLLHDTQDTERVGFMVAELAAKLQRLLQGHDRRRVVSGQPLHFA